MVTMDRTSTSPGMGGAAFTGAAIGAVPGVVLGLLVFVGFGMRVGPVLLRHLAENAGPNTRWQFAAFAAFAGFLAATPPRNFWRVVARPSAGAGEDDARTAHQLASLWGMAFAALAGGLVGAAVVLMVNRAYPYVIPLHTIHDEASAAIIFSGAAAGLTARIAARLAVRSWVRFQIL